MATQERGFLLDLLTEALSEAFCEGRMTQFKLAHPYVYGKETHVAKICAPSILALTEPAQIFTLLAKQFKLTNHHGSVSFFVRYSRMS